MKRNNPLIKAGALLAILAGLGISGASAADPTTAITCSKCKDVMVIKPSVANGKPGSGYVLLKNEKTMVCPNCESAIANFLKTGKLKHHCSACDGTMETCAGH